MSLANVERHRRINAAFNTQDADALVAVCDPEIEVHSVFAAVGGALYQGHAGVRRWLRDIVDAWSDFHVDAEAHFDLGDRVLALVTLHGRGALSGAEVVMPYAQMTEWGTGGCCWFKAYAHREDAMGEAGISEGSPEALP